MSQTESRSSALADGPDARQESTVLEVDLDLVRKYDRPGPRYTSYPTAPHFGSDFTREDWERHIRESNRSSERPLSLYFHVPFCDTLCWFCGCTMLVQRRREPIDRYVQALYREIELYAAHMHPEREVVQIHFGGGTPTHLAPDQIREIGRRIRSTFRVADDAEISVEMDPRGLTLEHIEALRDAGFNRASLGVQDFDPKVQRAINRVHDEALVGQVVDWIRGAGFESLNLDLIYGLPHQRLASVERTLEAVLALDPDRLAVFSYAHVPWMKPHQSLIREDDLPEPAEKLGMLKLVVETLTARGHRYVGMDHFARAGDELALAQEAGTLQRNFQGYSTRAGTDIHGFGMSSISQLPYAYAQHVKDLDEYYAAIDAGRLPLSRGLELTQDDFERRHVIMRLMCDMGLDYGRISDELGFDPATRYRDEIASLDEFEEDGLLSRGTSDLRVTPRGRLFIRNIAMAFDAYVEVGHARYSRTV